MSRLDRERVSNMEGGRRERICNLPREREWASSIGEKGKGRLRKQDALRILHVFLCLPKILLPKIV